MSIQTRVTAAEFLKKRGYDLDSMNAPGGFVWCITRGSKTAMNWGRWWDVERFASDLGWHEGLCAASDTPAE